MQASTARGSKNADKHLETSRILSGKRLRGSPKIYEAGPSSKVRRGSRWLKLKRLQFEPAWWRTHLEKRARVGFATLTSPTLPDVQEPELPQGWDAVDEAVEDVAGVGEGRFRRYRG